MLYTIRWHQRHWSHHMKLIDEYTDFVVIPNIKNWNIIRKASSMYSCFSWWNICISLNAWQWQKNWCPLHFECDLSLHFAQSTGYVSRSYLTSIAAVQLWWHLVLWAFCTYFPQKSICKTQLYSMKKLTNLSGPGVCCNSGYSSSAHRRRNLVKSHCPNNPFDSSNRFDVMLSASLRSSAENHCATDIQVMGNEISDRLINQIWKRRTW